MWVGGVGWRDGVLLLNRIWPPISSAALVCTVRATITFMFPPAAWHRELRGTGLPMERLGQGRKDHNILSHKKTEKWGRRNMLIY